MPPKGNPGLVLDPNLDSEHPKKTSGLFTCSVFQLLGYGPNPSPPQNQCYESLKKYAKTCADKPSPWAVANGKRVPWTLSAALFTAASPAVLGAQKPLKRGHR